MMSVMLVKELDCDIEPSAIHIFPSFLENKPGEKLIEINFIDSGNNVMYVNQIVLDLNAANGSQDAILTPLTSAFTIDIATKTYVVQTVLFRMR